MIPKISLLTLLISFSCLAADHTARIVKLENSSEVYVPGESKEEKSVHVKYLDSVYHVLPAVRGMKLENGYILTTGPNSKAKVIFKNGDHIYVSENTQYKIDWKRETTAPEKDSSVISLMRGAFRSLIQKDGPRAGMKVKTKNAVMGVRGTDFFVSEKHGALEVSVLRGQVVLLNEKKDKKEIKVQTGETLTKENKKITISAVAKEDLQEIARTTTLKSTSEGKSSADQKVIAELEEKAKSVTINDIKEYQPKLYEQIVSETKGKEVTSDSLALNTAKLMEKKAPHKSKKPSQSELEENQNPYEQYKMKED